MIRSKESYSGWAAQVAKEEGAYFIDLNELVAARYEDMGKEKVTPMFPADHTHTDKAGAQINAEIVVTELKRIKPGKLKKYFLKKGPQRH